jgi:hypothetical protein
MIALRARLTQQIESGFSDIEYPGDSALFGFDMTQKFIGKHWKNVPIEMLKNEDRFLHLSAKALHFYLPAYLIGIINHPEEMDALVDDMLHFLSPSSKPHVEAKTISYLPDFDPKQSAAILAFLEAYEELFPEGNWKYYPPTREALERAIVYWEQTL